MRAVSAQLRRAFLISLPPIPAVDVSASERARQRQQKLTKPSGALGQLEALSVRLIGMTGSFTWRADHVQVVVCAADHGIVAQGVSAYPQQVSQQMVNNMLNGGAAINVLARQFNCRLAVVNSGLATSIEIPTETAATFFDRPVAQGTFDFSIGPAMTQVQAEVCINTGFALAADLMPYDVLIPGEMGIGNTTSASAIIAAIIGCQASDVTGTGTGIDSQRLKHKSSLIDQALARHAPAGEDTLIKVGGFEIGMMAGLMLGAASQRKPILLDGLIATAAALIARQYAPTVTDYLIAGHLSQEPGHTYALDTLGLRPLLDLKLRLGEGSGAVLALPLVRAAMATLTEMATFDDASVSQAHPCSET